MAVSLFWATKNLVKRQISRVSDVSGGRCPHDPIALRRPGERRRPRPPGTIQVIRYNAQVEGGVGGAGRPGHAHQLLVPDGVHVGGASEKGGRNVEAIAVRGIPDRKRLVHLPRETGQAHDGVRHVPLPAVEIGQRALDLPHRTTIRRRTVAIETEITRIRRKAHQIRRHDIGVTATAGEGGARA
jgi:hypothetical protein